MKTECLTITTDSRMRGRSCITTTKYEFMQTTKSGETRVITEIEKDKTGKRLEYRFRVRKMDLTTGNYIDNYPEYDGTQPDKCKALIEAWDALPVKNKYISRFGTVLGETRFFR